MREVLILMLMVSCGDGGDGSSEKSSRISYRQGKIDPIAIDGIEPPPNPVGEVGKWELRYVSGVDGRYGGMFWVWVRD